MLDVGLYVAALSFPIWALALWEMSARLRRRTKRLQPVAAAPETSVDARLAVLEAQFIVAPNLAIAELRSELRKQRRASSLAEPFPSDPASFETFQRLALVFLAGQAGQNRRPQHRRAGSGW
jgi:hypothetical protein